jgi:chromosome segregation ATPase
VRQDWTLSGDTQKPEEKTANYYRFRVKVGPHEKFELPVTEQRVLMETYTLTNFTRQDLELFVAKNYIDSNTRTTLERIIDLRSRLAAKEARVESIDAEVEQIAKDQERLRDNIKALTATAEAKQLISRYVAKADNQETRLEQLNKEKQTLAEEIASLEGELETVVRGIAIDRKLID